MLHEGIVDFEFIKKDGSVRSAKGTLLAEYLPEKKADSATHTTSAAMRIGTPTRAVITRVFISFLFLRYTPPKRRFLFV